jgi:ribonuclease BN (tRNA processing enzyme)
VRLPVIGCSPAWPSPGGAQSGYLVDGTGRLLVDCGLRLAFSGDSGPTPVLAELADVAHDGLVVEI